MFIEKENWNVILTDMDRLDSNAERRYRRHNKSLEAMGDAIVSKETAGQLCTTLEESAEMREAAKKLHAAMAKLTTVQKQRINLYFFKGLSYRQIAKKQGANEASVRESVYGALKKLKKLLK